MHLKIDGIIDVTQELIGKLNNLNKVPVRHFKEDKDLYLYNLPDKFGSDGGCQIGIEFSEVPKLTERVCFSYKFSFILNEGYKNNLLKSFPPQGFYQYAWEWVRGGKLPGIEIRRKNQNSSVSGGIKPEEVSSLADKGCTVRPMWRSGGMATLYAYFNDMNKVGEKNNKICHEVVEDGGIFYGFDAYNYEDFFFAKAIQGISSDLSDEISVEVGFGGLGEDTGKVFLSMDCRDKKFNKEIETYGKLLNKLDEFEPRIMLHFFYGGNDQSWAPKFLSGIKVWDMKLNGQEISV